MESLNVLDQAILNTVAYADIFQYPLTEEQIHRYLINLKSTPRAVRNALRNSPNLAQRLAHHWPFYMLCASEPPDPYDPQRSSAAPQPYPPPAGDVDIVQTRLRRASEARRMWPYALYYGDLIARLPFVRMLAVTGALAMNNVDAGADIDYLIVTSPGRLWLCRDLVVAVVKWAGLHGVTLCPNYLISESVLVFPDQSLYAAHELAQMVPLHGLEIYQRMRQANGWTERILPNAAGQPYPATLGLGQASAGVRQPTRFKKAAERILGSARLAWLEKLEMRRKIRKYTHNRPGSPEIDFSADWCKGHFDRHGQKTLDSYTARLKMFGDHERLHTT